MDVIVSFLQERYTSYVSTNTPLVIKDTFLVAMFDKSYGEFTHSSDYICYNARRMTSGPCGTRDLRDRQRRKAASVFGRLSFKQFADTFEAIEPGRVRFIFFGSTASEAGWLG